MIQPIEDLLRARTGPMTDELVRNPGKFGLGQLPSRRTPAGTVNSVCGFCSTGCRLCIHVDEEDRKSLAP
jgi:assimilatory nitrate reductase catalytic subunit